LNQILSGQASGSGLLENLPQNFYRIAILFVGRQRILCHPVFTLSLRKYNMKFADTE
jgi:hypothetical protein